MIGDAKKTMRVVGGEHTGAVVEVEDYTFAVRLPMTMSKEEIAQLKAGDEPALRFALYYRSSISLQDDDGSLHQIEFLRPGNLSIRQAVELVLLPEANPGSKLT